MSLIPVITLPLGAELIIIAIGICYTLLAMVLQRKLTNPRKLREIQNRMKQLTKEMNDLTKANAPKEQIMAKQQEIMPLMSESMRGQLKSMFVLLPMFIAFYYLFIPNLPLGAAATATNMKTMFFVTVFVFGIAVTIFTTLWDRRKARMEQLQMREAAAAS